MKEINSSKISLCLTFPSEQMVDGQKFNVKQQKIIKSFNEQIKDLSMKNKQISSSKIKFEENKKQQFQLLKQLVNQRKKPEIQIKKIQNMFNKKQSNALNGQKLKSSNQTKLNKTSRFFKKQTKVYTQQEDNLTKRLTFQLQNQQNKKYSLKNQKNINKTICDQQLQNKDKLQKQQSKQNTKFNILKKNLTNTQKYIKNIFKSTVDIVQKTNNQNQNNISARTNKKRNCSILIFNNGDNEVNNENKIKQQNSVSNIKQKNKKQAISSFFIQKSSQFKSRKVQFTNFRQQNNSISSTIQSSLTSRIIKNSQLSKSNSKSKSKSKINSSIPSFIKQRQQKNQLLKKSSQKQKILRKAMLILQILKIIKQKAKKNGL